MTTNLMIGSGVARVSLELQAATGYSLASQVGRFKDLEQKFGIQIPDKYVIEDDGYSGADFSRPSIKQVLDWARAGLIQFVCYPHVDRFARNVEGGLATIRLFRNAGLQVLLGNLGWITDERSLKTQLTIGLLFAELQRDDINAKSLDGVLQKLRQKLAHGGGAPYGYRFVTKAELQMLAVQAGKERPRRPGNLIVVVPEHVKVVVLIFELAEAGLSDRAICRELIGRGISPPRKNWNPETISKILQRTTYATGVWHYRKRESIAPKQPRKLEHRHREKSSWRRRPESDWMALEIDKILDPTLYARVRESIDNSLIIGKDGHKHPTTGGQQTDTYLLTGHGISRCRICGAALKGKKNGKMYWYMCSRRDHWPTAGGNTCPSKKYVRGDLLEKTIWNAWREELGTPARIDALVAEHHRDLIADSNPAELQTLKHQQNRLLTQIMEASRKEIREDDPDLKAHYARMVEELKNERKLISKRIAALSATAETIQVDSQEIAELIRLGAETTVRAEQKAIIHDWMAGIRYADMEVEITFRVPTMNLKRIGNTPGLNCQDDQHHADNSTPYIYLKTFRRVA